MKPLAELIKPIEIKKTKEVEYFYLVEYFYSLGCIRKDGKKISKGYIGIRLAPFIRGEIGNRDYGLIYSIKDQCEKSNNSCMTFWYLTKTK